MMNKKVHLICNAHLDPVWLWQWNEGAAEALSTFRVAADFCEQYDTFVFNHNEAVLYRWIEEYDPTLFTRIQKLVKRGKWHIMGGWFLQPDCNMPSGESFVRQILTGRDYFQRKFGVTPSTAINFDSFGHTRGLVQIMKKAGYDSYIICRPDPKDCPMPADDFTWVGFDGSKVVVHRSEENYNSIKDKVSEKFEEFMVSHVGDATNCFLWGVGDHGGGPSRADLESLNAVAASSREICILHSTPESYFEQIAREGKEVPEFRASLQPCSPGCYTSQIRIKQKHRQLENELYMTEKMLSSASLQGMLAYPKHELGDAVYDLLFSEFHDALPGSAIKPVEEDTLRLLDHGLEEISRLKTKAFFALSGGQKKVVDGETPLLIYNPHPFPVEGIFECEFVLPKQNWNKEFSVPHMFRDGKEVPCQAEYEESNFRMDWRKHTSFRARLQPSQMNRFDFRFTTQPEKPAPSLKREGDSICFVNGALDIRINCLTGLIDRYTVNGVDYLGANAFLPEIVENGYSSWGFDMEKARTPKGVFRLMSPAEGTAFSGVENVIDSVRVIEDGPVRTIVEAVFRCKDSFLCLRYKLPKQGTEVEVETVVQWNEKNSMLKIALPTKLGEADYLGQTAFGTDHLFRDGREAVAQKWIGLFDFAGNRAFTCINDGTYGSDLKDGVIRLSLLRSAGYAAADFILGKAFPQDRYSWRMEQGERIFHFWLNAGPASERREQIEREAQIHNEKPFALPFCPSGEGRQPEKLIEIADAAVVLSAFKQAERSEDFIIRLYESCGTARRARISFPVLQQDVTLDFGPYEIKTLRYEKAAGKISESDLMEGILAENDRPEDGFPLFYN